MKAFLLFFVSLIIGFTVISIYSYWQGKQLGGIIHSENAVTTDFSLKQAPSESLKGNIASLSGTVKWLSRVATKPVQIHKPQMIQQGESLSTDKDGKAVVTVNKDIIISIFSDTDVNFIQLLPINFVLEQNEGSVMYQNTLQIPTSVRSFDLATLIIQGAVTISADKKNKTVTVTVDRGIAKEGYEDAQNDSNVVTVSAGEQFDFDDTTKEGSVTKIPGFVSNTQLPFGH